MLYGFAAFFIDTDMSLKIRRFLGEAGYGLTRGSKSYSMSKSASNEEIASED